MYVEAQPKFQLIDNELSEARLYRGTSNFKKLTGRNIADLLYLNTLALYMLNQDNNQKNYASNYASQTSQYGYFSLMRTHSTDLYMLAYAINNPSNRYITFARHRESKKFLKSLHFNERQFHAFIKKVSSRSDKRNEALSFFMRLENQLRIKDNRYKMYRRTVLDWGNLRYNSKQVIVTRVGQEIRRLGRSSELMTPLTKMMKSRNYQVASDYKKPRTSFTQRAAGTAAGALAGRYIAGKVAKNLGKNVDKYKKAGTGIGAVAGYWASGRKKQT